MTGERITRRKFLRTLQHNGWSESQAKAAFQMAVDTLPKAPETEDIRIHFRAMLVHLLYEHHAGAGFTHI